MGNKGNKGIGEIRGIPLYLYTLIPLYPYSPYTFIPPITEGRLYGYHFKIYPRSQGIGIF
jgi:hypothetical protein